MTTQSNWRRTHEKEGPRTASQAERLTFLVEGFRAFAEASQLPSRQYSATVDVDMHALPGNAAAAARQKHSSPAIDNLTNAGWSMRRLAAALEEQREYKISYTHLGTLLRTGAPPKLKRAILNVTKVRV